MSPFNYFRQHGRAIWFFVRQDLVDRYRSDWLGVSWLFLQPLIYIVLFSTVFSALMRARLPGVESGHGYTIYLISGLLVWNLFAQSVSRLSTWYRDRAHLYRKVSIGLLAPPLSVLFSEFVIYVVSMSFFSIFLWVIGHPISWHWVWLLLVMGTFLTFAFGVGVIAGMLEVFIPDIRRVIPIALQIGFWFSPIVYTVDILPDALQNAQQWNPVTMILQGVRQIILYGKPLSIDFILFPATAAVISVWILVILHRRIHRVLRDAL